MANWKEIQGRIHRAKKSENPAISLTALYEKTHDAMVAFELARHSEQTGDVAAAGRWYTAAAQGFRRPQWKAKAEEALARLGVALPESAEAVAVPGERGIAETGSKSENTEIAPTESGQAPSAEAAEGHGVEAAKLAALRGAETGDAAGSVPSAKRRRRGRRGGRRHRRGHMAAGEIATPARPVTPQPERAREPAAAAAAGGTIEYTPPNARGRSASQPSTEAYPTRVDEVPREVAGLSLRGRAGDPGLSSRMALLESQLRRMLASTPTGVDEADRAPAGPGVFLLSDTDLQTHYYIEACQTLRIGIGNLTRAGRQAAGRGAGSALKARLAKHLGISETKAAKYLSEHCVVRWLQLDEGANLLEHFAIAVLRPVLNE